jgi:Phage integrase family
MTKTRATPLAQMSPETCHGCCLIQAFTPQGWHGSGTGVNWEVCRALPGLAFGLALAVRPGQYAAFRPVPDLITSDLRQHLEALPTDAPLVFASSTGTPLAHSNFRRRVWLPALNMAGLPGIHFHDLRHTGNQLIANAGANPRELMARMGHDSSRAALIYLHSSEDRQRALADAVGDTARAQLARPERREKANRSGT